MSDVPPPRHDAPMTSSMPRPPRHQTRPTASTEFDSTADRAAVAVACRHLGLLTDVEAADCGLTQAMIAARVGRGYWTRLHRGVYIVGGAPRTYQQELLGRLLSMGPDAVASHQAAAYLWGIPGFGPVIEWSRPRGRSQRKLYGICHGSLWLPPTHVTVKDGVPVTTVARTLFDLAGVVQPLRVSRALDNAEYMNLCKLSDLHTVFDDLARQGRRGTVTMRDLLAERGAGYIPPNSRLETLGRKVLRDGGLDDFEVEKNLGGDHEWIGRVDVFFAAADLVVELDSRTYHQSLTDRERDRLRDNKLISQGFRVLRVTWNDLKQHPRKVVAEVAAARRWTSRTAS